MELPVRGMSVDDLPPLDIKSMPGPLSVSVIRTISQSVLTTSIVVLPENPNRKGFICYNNSGNSVYLTYGPTSVSATCTRILATFTQFEMIGPIIYTGPISAIRNSGNGALIFTEFV